VSDAVADLVPGFTLFMRPCFHSLVFDSGVKGRLLEYINTTFLFSDRLVDDNLITWNRGHSANLIFFFFFFFCGLC